MEPRKRAHWFDIGGFVLIGLAALAAYYYLGGRNLWPFNPEPPPALPEAPSAAAPAGPPIVELKPKQLQAIRIGRVEPQTFQIVKPAVGNVDFNQDLSAPAFSPYQGRILQVFVNLGDRVKRGDPLFSIESPDLLTAEATLIQTAGVLDLANANLARLRGSAKLGGAAQKDLDQAISDQKTAEGNYKSARLAVAIFGKTEEEADAIARTRAVDHALVVRSPLDGVVSARAAAPGLLVQAGNAPAPVTVSDDSSMWLNAFVSEGDVAGVTVGAAVTAHVPAASAEAFVGRIARIGGTVDPATRRQLARVEIDNSDRKLRAGMIATFDIVVGKPVVSPSIPTAGVVREGDGAMTAWVRKDESHFVQRVVTLGVLQDGRRQVLSGLSEGEPVIVDGAIFIDNMLNAGPSD